MKLARNTIRWGHRHPWHLTLALSAAICATATASPMASVSAQSVGIEIAETDTTHATFRQVDSLLAIGLASEALARLEGRLAVFPHDVEARWRAAKAATLVGILSPRLIAARPYYRAAIAHAGEALKLNPNLTDALTWSMLAKGRLALWTGARETVDLAEDVWDISHRLLTENDDNALAHHALGVLHFQVLKMGQIPRFLARTFVGSKALSKANWELALFHLERAVILDPRNKMFRLAYAQALAKHGYVKEGLAEAEVALAQPVTNALDRRQQDLLQHFVRSMEG